MLLGGHRGLGCTDHDFYQAVRDVKNLPVENTLESLAAAFDRGADYVEIDAVMSGDSILFILHNVVPKDHFFAADMPPDLLNRMDFAAIARFKTGRFSNGVVARLEDVLKLAAEKAPAASPFAINIEIKGVQGSGQRAETNDFLKRLADMVAASPLPAGRVLFSSFSMKSVIDMSHLLPRAQYGMLFAERAEGRPIYADHQDDLHYRYLVFNAADFNALRDIWAREASGEAKLSYVHPEIMTVTDDMIGMTASAGYGMNVWAIFEELTAERKAVYKKVQASCRAKGVDFTAITDYIDAMKSVLT